MKMTRNVAVKANIKGLELEIYPLRIEVAEFLRRMCDHIGLPAHCPFKNCKRTNKCSTADILCWQVLREHMNPMIRDYLNKTRRGPLCEGYDRDR